MGQETANSNPVFDALAAIEGLTIADCLMFFEAKATERDKQIVALAETKDGHIEVDGTITSEGNDNGAYVLAWLWVDFEGTPLSKFCETCQGEDEVEPITMRDGEIECLCRSCRDELTCPDCGAVEGTDEWGTVGDGFDGYCPSCADKREKEAI